MPALSIVIVNYNTAEETGACIQSIYKYTTNLDVEVIVVDNGSVEKASADLGNKFPQIKFLRLGFNEGFGRGNNAGIAIATASTILLLNSDTLIFDDAIERTFHFLMSGKEVAMVGCKLLNEDGSEQISSYIPVKHHLLNLWINTNIMVERIASLFPALRFYSHHYEVTKEYQQKSHRCDGVSGAFMMFKNDIMAKIGYFDPDFFLYSEETEWCRNRIQKKASIMYFSDAAVIHLGGRSAPAELSRKQMLLSSLLYNMKVGYGFYFACICIHFSSAIMNLPFILLMKKENAKSVWRGIVTLFKIIPDIVFEIPRYGRKLGSRPAPLKIREWRVSNRPDQRFTST